MYISKFLLYIVSPKSHYQKKKVHKFIFTTNPFIILKSVTFRVNFTHYQAFISTI